MVAKKTTATKTTRKRRETVSKAAYVSQTIQLSQAMRQIDELQEANQKLVTQNGVYATEITLNRTTLFEQEEQIRKLHLELEKVTGDVNFLMDTIHTINQLAMGRVEIND